MYTPSQNNPFAPPAKPSDEQLREWGVLPPAGRFDQGDPIDPVEEAKSRLTMFWVVLGVLLVSGLLVMLAVWPQDEGTQARSSLTRMTSVAVQDVVEQARAAGITELVYSYGGVADESNGADWIVDRVGLDGDVAVLYVHTGRIRPFHPFLPPRAHRQPETHTNEGVGQVFTSWPAKPGFVTFECARCEGETTVTTSAGDVLFKANGPYKGTHWINMDDDAPIDYYQVKATSAWSLTVADFDKLPSFGEGGPGPSGTGDTVFLYNGSKDSAKVENVDALKAAGYGDNAVKTLDDGRFQRQSIIQVSAGGAWSITPR